MMKSFHCSKFRFDELITRYVCTFLPRFCYVCALFRKREAPTDVGASLLEYVLGNRTGAGVNEAPVTPQSRDPACAPGKIDFDFALCYNLCAFRRSDGRVRGRR